MNSPTMVCAILSLAASFAAVAADPVYRIKEISNHVGGRVYQPAGFNDLGQIVGKSDEENGAPVEKARGFVWNPATGDFKLLQPLPASPGVLTSAWATDINNKGQVVGNSVNFRTDRIRAVLWSKSGVPRALASFPRQIYSVANAINDESQIVGQYYRSGRWPIGVIWQGSTGMELGLPKGKFFATFPLGINDSGYVVGYHLVDDESQPFIWNPNSGDHEFLPMIPNGDLAESSATDINNAGKIVGASSRKAATWNKTTHAVSDVQTPFAPGADFGVISDINDRNEMVGTIDGVAYLWKGGNAYKLQDRINPTSSLAGCVDLGRALINDVGVIAAAGFNTCVGMENLYVLTPLVD